MYNKMRIAAVLAFLLFCQVYGRPDRIHNEDDAQYSDDTPAVDYDEDPSDDDSNGPPAEPPEIKTKPQTLRGMVGDTIELPCVVENAEELTITWTKDNQTLFFGETAMEADKSRMTVSANHTLTIQNLNKTDSSDNYVCKVSSDPPEEITHTLRVMDEEDVKNEESNRSIHIYPGKRVEVNESESVTLRCEVKQSSRLEIKWFHRGVRLNNSEGIEVNGDSITIKSATRHHSGRYQCLVEDKSEEPMTESIEVIVKYAPIIEVEHEVVHTGIAVTTELVCKVHAHPKAKVTWMKEDQPVQTKKDKKKISEDKSNKSLTVLHTNKHDFGPYRCVAKNIMGEASKEILVAGTPSVPEFIGGEIADDETTMILKWHVRSFSPIMEYKLEYRPKGDANWTIVYPSVRDGKDNLFVSEHALKGLQPGVTYEAKLMAKNDFGWSPQSKIYTFIKEYATDEPQKSTKGNSSSTTSRSMLTLTTALLVLSYISTNI